MADWTELNNLSPQELAKIKYNDPRLDSFASAVEERYQLPSGLIEAVKNAGERTQTGQVSPKGAKGVMQFMDATRKTYEHDYNDPRASINAAGMYFRDLLKQYNGNVKAAVSAYNGGTKAGKAVLAGQEPPSAETRNYLGRMFTYMEKKTAAQPQQQPVTSNETFVEKAGRVLKGELVSDVFDGKKRETSSPPVKP
jgi:soluble lytic murein transglycosylase-like protein